ncbi:hypothetical protein CDCA_CDCA15G3985 [Cyanidium caldarium]|uniref:CAP domain-containing protein n=1 Tax=Cyanidium caldarium TaxID=2771 RepID=A0AAV9J0W3_CYACA|nr:hypothetical protein CDCA_CDCA15G3985 [Cyanidium caldarium]
MQHATFRNCACLLFISLFLGLGIFSPSKAAPSHHPHRLSEDVAATLNLTQLEYSIGNALYQVNPKLCLNHDLTLGSLDVGDLLTFCSLDEVSSGHCAQVNHTVILQQLAAAGWHSDNISTAVAAGKFSESLFNFTEGSGLHGRSGYEVATKLAPTLIRQLSGALHARQQNLLGVGTIILADFEVYAFVVLGASPHQFCYGHAPGETVFEYVEGQYYLPPS